MIGLELDIERHRCAILGRRLGKIDAVAELEDVDLPPLNEALSGYDAVNIGSSLANWVREAERALDQTETEQINTWNLDCVGSWVAADAGIRHDAPEAAFDGGAVYGDIDSGFFERFLAHLNANPNIDQIALGSGGGSVKDAILAGREIRRRGIETTLYGNCYSACPLVYVGGTNRTIWAEVKHDLGFHRLSLADGTALPDDHEFYGLIADYLEDMGVDSATYIGWMQSAGPESMFTPDPWTLCDAGIATWVQRICAR